MRITWAPLAMMAEVRRTTTGEDPAARWSAFRNMGTTYLYKVLPDGSEARDDDNEYPHLDARDNVVLGYAVHRFKDPYAAWLLQQRAWLPAEWANPVLQFLWNDPAVVPRDPATTTETELPRHRHFRGVGHLVLRDGWGQGLHLDPARLRAVPREARPPGRGAPRRVPQGLPGDRRRGRLHRHREPALPQPLPADDRPQHGARVPAGRALLLEREPVAGGERRRPADGLLPLLEQRAQPRGLAPHARPVGPLPAVARGRRAHVPLRARRRDPRLPAVEARVVHARDRAPARDERPRRARPRARGRPVLPQGLAAPRRERAEGRWRPPPARASVTAGRPTATRPW